MKKWSTILGLSVLGLLGFYGYLEISRRIEALRNISSSITSLHDLWASWSQIDAKINIELQNNSKYPIGIHNSLIQIEKIDFYNRKNGLYLGSAQVNLHGIQIPANGTLQIKDIHVKVPMSNLLENIDLFKGDISENIYIKLSLKSLGQDLLINSKNYN